MKKQAVLELLDRFPVEVNTEDLIRKLHLKAKLDEAREQARRGEGISHEAFVEKTNWYSL